MPKRKSQLYQPKSNSFRISLAISTLLHAAPFLLMAFLAGSGGGGHGKGSGSDEEKKAQQEKNRGAETGDIIPKKPIEITIEEIKPGFGKKKAKPQKPVHASDKCEDSFGGIGVAFDIFAESGTIHEAAEGYPAALAGVKSGDRIVTPAVGTIKGKVGTEVEITYVTSIGEVKTVTLIRDKICVSKTKDKKEKVHPTYHP